MVGYEVINADVTEIKLHEDLKNEKNNISFNTSCYHAENDKKKVKAVIDVTIFISKRFSFKFKYNMYFILESEIEENGLSSLMDEIGLHELAYPYIRSYAMNILALSGYHELYLPLVPKF
ncbi:hypothetical protein [Providencia stuartii]|uniref:hypothetical protein n=1 Tax=Providencia stuartii TaxID=588 RepID=UPI001123886F|nr:hypothetical protein [Providencia stuartii]